MNKSATVVKQAADSSKGPGGLWMIAAGFKRVSKTSPCCICGKPDWCSTTATEAISFCARSTLNADRVSRFGWGVFYHDASRSGFSFNFKRNFKQFAKAKRSKVSHEVASAAILDKVYRKLIELSPATSNHEIVNGRGGLIERGIYDLSRYGNLPRLVNARRVLVERLVEEVGKEGLRSFDGIPGLWKDSHGRLRLWSKQDAFDDLMLIPFVGPDELIRACQIRFMRYLPIRSGRYVWLSSLKEIDGSGPGAPLHHVRPRNGLNLPVVVTEGALKAATAQRFLPDRYVVGNSGVATAHREIVNTARGRKLEIAFDNDSFTNPHVARALAGLLRLRYSDQAAFGFEAHVRIITWDRSVKGIDDALLDGLRLEYLSVAEWLKGLTPECFERASHQLASIDGEQTGGRQTAVWPSRTSCITFP